MTIMLMLSSFATTLLIAPWDYQHGGKASGRAIAFLAHRYFGGGFGTVYDLSTILILGLAGASAMAGLLQLIPRYLPRFGMAPRWAELSRPLVLTLFAIDVVITLIFRADVEAQSGAYATGVLVLILSAALAATLALRRERRWGLAFYFAIFCVVFSFTLAENCLERPDGLIIGTVYFFDQCQHRMACAKCDFYMPKDSTAALLLEGRTHLLRLLQEIPLGEAEQAAVKDGVAAYENLLSKLSDVPTPAGPTLRQLGAGLVQITSVRPPLPASTLTDSRSNGAGSRERINSRNSRRI
jgi:hypothetical protein